MLPAFRSNKSVLSFCGLMVLLLALPVVTLLVGHPSREQAYAGMSDAAGLVGVHVREMFQDKGDPDVLFLGSSLVTAGIDGPTIQEGLSRHLGRPAKVEILGLNWQGVDLQYFLLRDYLATHHPALIIWNPPFPGSRDIEPHLKAYHWVRFGEYTDALEGLPLGYRLTLYGEMVLGAPRELLSHIRRNRIGDDELYARLHSEGLGYYGRPFVAETVDTQPLPPLDQAYEEPRYPLEKITGKPINVYEDHFAKQIFKLAEGSRSPLALIYVPVDSDRGKTYVPERNDWPSTLNSRSPLIGPPSAVLFEGMDDQRFYHFYRDQHLNKNGNALYTRSILPAILKAYDERDKYE